MSDVDLKKLTEPFPRTAIKSRTGGGGKKLDYIEGHTVIHRLNDATGNHWSLELRALDTMQLGSRTLLRAHVALTIPGLGTREHIGVQAVDERGGEDLVKGAVTDALKKSATLFGVGLELFGPDYEAGEITDAPPRNRSTTRNTVPDAPQAPSRHETPEKVSEHPTMDQRGLTAIFAQINKRGVSNDDLHTIVRHRYGVESLKELRVDHGRDLYTLLQKSTDDDLKHELWLANGSPEPAQAEMMPDTAGRARA